MSSSYYLKGADDPDWYDLLNRHYSPRPRTMPSSNVVAEAALASAAAMVDASGDADIASLFENANGAPIYYLQAEDVVHPWGFHLAVGEVVLRRGKKGTWHVGPATDGAGLMLGGDGGWLRTTESDEGRLSPEGLGWDAYRGKLRGYAAAPRIDAREVKTIAGSSDTAVSSDAAPALANVPLRGMSAESADGLVAACVAKSLDVLHHGRMMKREGSQVSEIWAPRMSRQSALLFERHGMAPRSPSSFFSLLTPPLSSHQSAAILLVSDNQRPSFCRTANVKSIMVLVSQTRVSLSRHIIL